MSAERLVVTGVWCVSPYGSGPGALLDGWLSGVTAIAPVRRFATDGLAAHRGGEMPEPSGPWPGGMRGAAHLGECVTEALDRSGVAGGQIGVICATAKGFLDCGVRVTDGHPAHDVRAPARFVADLIRARARHRRSARGARVAPMTISTACASGTVALAVAAARAAEFGRSGTDALVIAGIDLLSDFVFRGFAALGALDPAPCRPFDITRAGLSPAEGAAALVLETESAARRRGAPILAVLRGWGLSNDCRHPTAPARDGDGMARAISMALATAGVAPSELGHVHAHGTGTPFNDAMEIRALTQALGAAASTVPVTTLKGSTGHAFGASGLLETIASIAAGARGVVPPITGLAAPEPGLRTLREALAPASPLFLKTSAGFGGFNAALVVETQPTRRGDLESER